MGRIREYASKTIAVNLDSCDSSDCYDLTMRDYYDQMGYPIDDLVNNPRYHNPLGESKWLEFADPHMLLQMNEGENTRFLKNLSLDPDYIYNYERVYINALKVKYEVEYQEALDPSQRGELYQSMLDIFHDEKNFLEMVGEQINEYMKAFEQKGSFGGTNE